MLKAGTTPLCAHAQGEQGGRGRPRAPRLGSTASRCGRIEQLRAQPLVAFGEHRILLQGREAQARADERGDRVELALACSLQPRHVDHGEARALQMGLASGVLTEALRAIVVLIAEVLGDDAGVFCA